MLVCYSALKMNDLIYLPFSAGHPGNEGPRWCVFGLPICFHLGGILFCKRCISLQCHPSIKWQVWRKWGQIFSNKKRETGKKKTTTLFTCKKKSSTTNLVTHGYTQPDSFLLVIFLLSSEISAAMKMHLFERYFIIACCSFTITLQICAEKWVGWMTIHPMLMNQECAMKSLLKLIISFRNWRCIPDLLLAFSSFSCSSALPMPPFFLHQFLSNYSKFI